MQKPNSEWFFYKPGISYYTDRLIVLNAFEIKNVDNGIININYRDQLLGKYIILEKYENCFYLQKLND